MLHAATIALLAGALALPQTARPAPVLVSAAISLTDALREIEPAYAAAGGGPVHFNFAASNVLARQIANGAPADLFISADLTQMDYAERAGAIDAATRRPLLGNRLAVVTPTGRGGITAPRDLAAPTVRRIAIGDPAAVPAGRYARDYLERAGLWAAVQPRLLPLANVRAALAAAESGGADAAIVYESDAIASRRVRTAFVVPAADGPAIVYPAAVVARTRRRAEALRLLEFLASPPARAIFARHGFTTPATR